MLKTYLSLIACVLSSIVAPSHAQTTQPSTVAITVDGAAPREWSVNRIQSELGGEVHMIDFELHGAKHHAHAVPLILMLQKCGVPTEIKMNPKADPKTKNLPLRMSVLISATDGYAAVFSLAEMLPQIGGHPVWVQLDQDDQPLADRDGPMKLVAPDDKAPGRWLRSIATVRVATLPPG